MKLKIRGKLLIVFLSLVIVLNGAVYVAVMSRMKHYMNGDLQERMNSIANIEMHPKYWTLIKKCYNI